MKLGPIRQVAISVGDLDRSVEFYRDTLGLTFVARFGNLAFFDLDGTRLLLEHDGNVDARSVLYFSVPDIRAAHEALTRAGVTFVDDPHVVFVDASGTFGTANEAEWMAFFEDPDGNVLAISSREAAAKA